MASDDPKAVLQREHARSDHCGIFAQRVAGNGIIGETTLLGCLQTDQRSCHDCRLGINGVSQCLCVAVCDDRIQIEAQNLRSDFKNFLQCSVLLYQIQSHLLILRTLSGKKCDCCHNYHSFLIRVVQRCTKSEA